MRKTCLGLIVATVLLAAPACADPNPQLVSSVQMRLAHYGLVADVSKFDTATVAELHLTLSSPEGYMKTRRELRNILRRATFK